MSGLRPDAYAFDLDGTIYLAEEPLPGAVALTRHLRERGVPHLFATNNSSVSGERYLERLSAMGIEAARANLVTSNDVAAAHLRGAGVSRAYLLATPEVVAEYAAAGIAHVETDPEAVVLTFDTTLDYAKIVAAARLLGAGLPYFATHPDLVCPTPQGPVPDCGSFAALFAAATGREPVVLGKPSGAMAGTVRARLTALAEAQGAAAPTSVAFVGDRLYTDVRMANEHGFTAVLTLTGEASRGDLRTSPHTADVVVDGLDDLLRRLEGRGPLAAPA